MSDTYPLFRLYESGIYVVRVSLCGQFDLFVKTDDGQLVLRDFGSKLTISELAMMVVMEGEAGEA
jgi:hypothetical protein